MYLASNSPLFVLVLNVEKQKKLRDFGSKRQYDNTMYQVRALNNKMQKNIKKKFMETLPQVSRFNNQNI